MAQVSWTEPALNDLDEIAEYIALSNYSAAQNLIEVIFDKVTQLELLQNIYKNRGMTIWSFPCFSLN